MVYYMLAQVTLKYGTANLERFTKVLLPDVARRLKEIDIRLCHCLVTEVGQLFEVWDLWDLGETADMARMRDVGKGDPTFPALSAALGEVIESEQIRILSSYPLALSGLGETLDD